MHFIRRLFAVFAYLAIYIRHAKCQSSIGTFQNGNENFSTERSPHESIVCMNINSHRSIDIKQIMGKWYGNEIIIHSQDVPGVFQYDSCVIIQISNITDHMPNQFYNDYRRSEIMHQHDPNRQQQRQFRQQQQQQQQSHQEYNPNHDHDMGLRWEQPKFLQLLWSERDDTLEYIFNYTDDNPGRWTNFGEQRGSLVTLNHYTQFNGIVQVVKAGNDHLVLTFCGNNLKTTIYTIVLSRQPQGLTRQQLHDIRSLLSSRHLSVDTIRKICSSAAASLKASVGIILLFGIIVSAFPNH